MTHLVTTPAERAALPVGHVVVSASGTVACRATQEHGVVFGNSRTFPWDDLALPLTVLYPATPDVAQSTGPSMLDALGRTVVAGDRIAVSDVHYEEAVQRVVTVTGVRTVEPSWGEAPFEVASYQLDGYKYERSARSREIVRIDSGSASAEVQWAIVYDGLSEDDIEPVTEHQARVWAALPMYDGQDVLVSRDAAYGPWRKTR